MDDAAALATLPPLPEPNRWEQRSEACCGSSLVLALCGGFVAATRHMSSKMIGHEVLRQVFVVAIHTEAVVALLCLSGLLWGDPGVVQRNRSSSLPLPAQVQQVLEVGQSISALQNIKDGDDVYCVRCCVWRRTRSSCSNSIFCDDGMMDNFHHCSTCQRCVVNFDHHCGVFGRCIAGRGFSGNMGFFKVIISMAMAGAVTCFASIVMVLINQEEGSILAVVLLAYISPMLLGCCILLCSMLWPEEGCQDRIGRLFDCQKLCDRRSYAVLPAAEENPMPIGASIEMWRRSKSKFFWFKKSVTRSRRYKLETMQEANRVLHEQHRHHSWSSHVEKSQLTQAHEGKVNEVASLNEKLEVAFCENAQLRAELESLTCSKMQTEHSHRGLEANLATVNKDLEHRVNRQATLEEHAIGLQRQLEKLEAEKVRAEHVLSSQHVELMALQKLHADLHSEKAQNQSLRQKMETSDVTFTKTQEEKEELEKMVSSLHSECAKVRTQRDSLSAEVPHLKASLQQQESLLKEQEHEVSLLQNKLKSLHKTNGVLDKEAKHMTYTLQRVQEEKKHVEQVGLSLRAERQQLLEALERLRQSKAESHARLNSAASESSVLQARCQQMHTEREQLQLRLQQSLSESAALRSQLVGMEKMVQEYSDEISALKVKSLQASQEAHLQAEKHAAPAARSGMSLDSQTV